MKGWDLRIIQKEKEILISSPPIVDAWIGSTYALMGNKDKAQEILNDLLTRSELEYVSPYCLARLHFALGQNKEGLGWLEKAYEERDNWLRYLKVYPFESFTSASSEPRFKAILRKMGFE